MKTTLSILCSLALPISLSAQDAELQALTLKTTSAQIAENLLGAFDSDADVPEVGEGSYFILSLDDGGEINVKTAEGKTGFLLLEARPGLLMELFEDEVDNARQMAQMFGGMGLGQVGVAAQDVNSIIGGLFDFPAQIETLTVSVPVDPNGGSAIDATIEVIAVDGSWLGNLLADTQPNQSGVRMLEGADSMISMIGNIHLPSMVKHLDPIMDIMAGIGMDTDDERKESLEFSKQANEAYDGTMCVLVDADFHARSIQGLDKPSVFTELWNNKRFVEIQTMRSETSDMVAMEITPKASKYQDVDIHKFVLEFDNPEMAGPFAEDGKQTTFLATAGKYGVSANSKSDLEALIDEALDSDVKRTKVTSLLKMSVDLDSFLDLLAEMTQGQLPPIGEGAPASLKVEVNKKGKALVIGVNTK